MAARGSRRPHFKSRNGCANCKRRRIKCDEQRPACSNCSTRSIECSLGLESSAQVAVSSRATDTPECILPDGLAASRDNTPGAPEASSIPQSLLNVEDLKLLHHYMASTSYSLANLPDHQAFLRINAPEMGFSHPFLLHGILALSALHLAHFKKDSHSFYLSQAHGHYDIALRTAATLLEKGDPDSFPALYIFSNISTFFSFGLGPLPDDFLLFRKDGESPWLINFRGVRAILEANEYALIKHSELAPLFHVLVQHFEAPLAPSSQLEELRELVMEVASGDSDLQVYMTAIEDLAQSFPREIPPRGCKNQIPLQLVFAWLYRLSDEFINCLHLRKPIALVILAHFCPLMNDLSSLWWMTGWVDHLLSEIYNSLDSVHRMWIRSPIQQIGWLPR